MIKSVYIESFGGIKDLMLYTAITKRAKPRFVHLYEPCSTVWTTAEKMIFAMYRENGICRLTAVKCRGVWIFAITE